MTSPESPISLEIHIIDQRRSYRVSFATEAQALAFVTARSSTHAVWEIDELPIPATATALLELLYPICEHGLSLSNCYGPQHYYFDETEQALGYFNS